MISAEMAEDVSVFATWFEMERRSPLVWSSEFEHPRAEEVSSDAFTPLHLGWVLHAFGTLACLVWTTSTRQLIQSGRISINLLELVASAAPVLLLGENGLIYGNLQISLQSDNTTA